MIDDRGFLVGLDIDGVGRTRARDAHRAGVALAVSAMRGKRAEVPRARKFHQGTNARRTVRATCVPCDGLGRGEGMLRVLGC
eukprot:scaffold101_cov230-Pinguiococcus_pyrenoidosus.AAC.3